MGAWKDLDAFRRKVVANTPMFDQTEYATLEQDIAASPAIHGNGVVNIKVDPALVLKARKLFEGNEITTMGWKILFTRGGKEGTIFCQLSASTHPDERSLTGADYLLLKKIAKRLGYPHDDLPDAAPSGVFHWAWGEGTS